MMGVLLKVLEPEHEGLDLSVTRTELIPAEGYLVRYDVFGRATSNAWIAFVGFENQRGGMSVKWKHLLGRSLLLSGAS